MCLSLSLGWDLSERASPGHTWLWLQISEINRRCIEAIKFISGSCSHSTWPDRFPVGKGRIPVLLYIQGQATALPRASHPQYWACWARRTPLEPYKFPVTPAQGRFSLFHKAEVSRLGLPGLDLPSLVYSLPETSKVPLATEMEQMVSGLARHKISGPGHRD